MNQAKDSRPARLTFIGDVMCERSQIDAYSSPSGQPSGSSEPDEHGYDFTAAFRSMKSYFSASDYTAANLETPLAGAEQGFTSELYSFNTPAEFAEALKAAGVDLVSTANNHCLDRGISGLTETLRSLDRIGLDHVGTYASREERVPFIREIGGLKVGFLSYTYGTNAFLNCCYLKRHERFMVKLTQKQELSSLLSRYWFHHPDTLFAKIYGQAGKLLLPRQFALPVYERRERRRSIRRKMIKDINSCRAAGAELIICLTHMGGQYNQEASEESKALGNFLIDHGVNAVIGHHEHVVHGSDFTKLNDNQIVTYSLGNFIGEAGVIKEPFDRRGEYSILLNLYASRVGQEARIARCSFSIAKAVLSGSAGGGQEDTVSKSSSETLTEDNGKTAEAAGKQAIKVVLLYDLVKAAHEPRRAKLIADNAAIVRKFLSLPESETEKIPLQLEYDVKELNASK